MRAMHDLLSESEQLAVYRFYLTAVHRNSVMTTRFHPTILSSPERSAAVEAEYDEISRQLEDLVADVAAFGLDGDSVTAQLHAADFLWAVSWWVHARRDVLMFDFDRLQDPVVSLLLGRAPSSQERVSKDLYEHAVAAELEYRGHASHSNPASPAIVELAEGGPDGRPPPQELTGEGMTTDGTSRTDSEYHL
jgi:hypothetical protein